MGVLPRPGAKETTTYLPDLLQHKPRRGCCARDKPTGKIGVHVVATRYYRRAQVAFRSFSLFTDLSLSPADSFRVLHRPVITGFTRAAVDPGRDVGRDVDEKRDAARCKAFTDARAHVFRTTQQIVLILGRRTCSRGWWLSPGRRCLFENIPAESRLQIFALMNARARNFHRSNSISKNSGPFEEVEEKRPSAFPRPFIYDGLDVGKIFSPVFVSSCF